MSFSTFQASSLQTQVSNETPGYAYRANDGTWERPANTARLALAGQSHDLSECRSSQLQEETVVIPVFQTFICIFSTPQFWS